MSKENKRERESKRKEKLAEFLFYDMAKIIFAGTVLIFAEPIVKKEYYDSESAIFILLIGVSGTIIFAFCASRILK